MFLHVSVCRGGSIPACLAGFQAHTQGGAWGIWPWGGLQAHIKVGSWGVWPGGPPGPYPEGKLRGLTWEGGLKAYTKGGLQAHIPACIEANHLWLTATAAGGTHPTGMHSCHLFYSHHIVLMLFRLKNLFTFEQRPEPHKEWLWSQSVLIQKVNLVMDFLNKGRKPKGNSIKFTYWFHLTPISFRSFVMQPSTTTNLVWQQLTCVWNDNMFFTAFWYYC